MTLRMDGEVEGLIRLREGRIKRKKAKFYQGEGACVEGGTDWDIGVR